MLEKGMIKSKERDSNMEMLRIISMLLVLVVHADFSALSAPTPEDININATSVFFRFLMESISIIAVNVFVLLSGWYGIKPKTTRLLEFLFQVLFFGIICMSCEWLLTGNKPDKALLTVLTLSPTYWFFKTYLALYIISPILNAFVENSSRQLFKNVLISFFAFQSTFNWLVDGASWISWGYSLPSFAGLYLLARYMHIYRPKITRFHYRTDICLYLGFVIFNTLSAFFLMQIGKGSWLYVYTSPLVIMGGGFFLLFFSKLTLKSRFINWVAVSAFSVYLTHANAYLAKYYNGTILRWFNENSTFSFILCTATLIIGVFIVSVLLDKVRILLWNWIKKMYNKQEINIMKLEL